MKENVYFLNYLKYIISMLNMVYYFSFDYLIFSNKFVNTYFFNKYKKMIDEIEL